MRDPSCDNRGCVGEAMLRFNLVGRLVVCWRSRGALFDVIYIFSRDVDVV